ncbi:hypothetical protein MAQ58_24365, partial [Enterobacter sp. DRP3]|nr:hypothetical protein [Enterobacter sp. DRP3]
VFASGPLMRNLFEALPVSRRGGVADTAADLIEPLTRNLRSGDAVMVKGSNGSRMGRIVDVLKARYAVDPARRGLAAAP